MFYLRFIRILWITGPLEPSNGSPILLDINFNKPCELETFPNYKIGRPDRTSQYFKLGTIQIKCSNSR